MSFIANMASSIAGLRTNARGLVSPVAVLAIVACGTVESPAGDVPLDAPVDGAPVGDAPVPSASSLGDARLTASDVPAVLARAAQHRVFVDNSFGGGGDPFVRIDVIDSIGITNDAGMLDPRVGRPLTDVEHRAIAAALAPLPVEFVPASVFDDLDPTHDPRGRAILTLGEPEQMERMLVIASQLWCGGLCGTGGANELVRSSDGSWTVGAPVGPQWIS